MALFCSKSNACFPQKAHTGRFIFSGKFYVCIHHFLDLSSTEKGREQIMSLLSLCDPVRSQVDVLKVKYWLAETWFNLAMVDYPYPANFLEPLPGFPIKVWSAEIKHSFLKLILQTLILHYLSRRQS